MNLLGLILLSLAMGFLAWLAFYWSVKSGQYDDPEGPKYRMLEDDDEVPPPAAEVAPKTPSSNLPPPDGPGTPRA